MKFMHNMLSTNINFLINSIKTIKLIVHNLNFILLYKVADYKKKVRLKPVKLECHTR